MPREKRWTLTPPDPGRAADLGMALKVSPVVAQVLLNRGFDTPESAATFLRPTLKQLHDPSLMAGLDVAAERVARAVRDREKIVVYGDYDVDGITAVSILWHAIRTLGGVVEYYIPHRLEEGYGLNAEAVADLCDHRGAKLIVTVDCGVTAVEPAKAAREREVDLIVTDHHEWRTDAAGDPVLPDCAAIVHPRLPGPSGRPYPNPHLCGAGVAFKLAWGIGKAVVGAARVGDMYRAFLLDATALAALGTIADVVPLVGENRVLATAGLGGLKQTKLTGIRALIDSAGLGAQTSLDSYDVGFRLGPRLNASGRMGHAKLAAEMLTDATPDRAREIADYLEQQNHQRQATERAILEQAVALAEAQGCDDGDGGGGGPHGLVLASEGWHAGVVGIVASRIVERFARPAVLVALSNGHGAGSGRSIAGFHLADALASCGHLLETHGGHEMAAGLKLRGENLAPFTAAFTAYAAAHLTAEQLVPEVKLEVAAELAQLTPALVTDLGRVAPFGQGNRRPLVRCTGLTVAGPPRVMGKAGNHLSLLVRQGGATVRCVAFNGADWANDLRSGSVIDLAVEPKLNTFNGQTSVELEVKDLKTAGD